MNNELNILFVEDSIDDLELTLLYLNSNAYKVHYQQVENKKGLLAALMENQWDLILSDFVMPSFSGLEVIQIVKDFDKLLPIIIISGEIGEDVAIETLRNGADDYIMKNNLKRLSSAIQKVLHEKETEKRLQQKTLDLQMINQLNHLANIGKNLNEIADFLNTKATEYFGAQFTTLFTIDIKKQKGVLHTISLINSVKDKVEQIIDKKIAKREINFADEGIIKRLEKYKKPFLILDKNSVLESFVQALLSGNYDKEIASQIKQAINLKSVICTPLYYNHELIGMIDIVNKINPGPDDILRMESLQLELASIVKRKLIEKELMEAKAKAEESNELKNRFLANLSHEIRTPMNAIVGFSQLMVRTNLRQEERKLFSKHIKNNCNLLLENIENIIDISLLQANQLKLTYSTFSVNQLLDEIHKKYKTLRIEKNKAISVKLVQNDTELFLKSDKNRLLQILDNIMSNSFKYTDRGEISLQFMAINNGISFRITDTGIGISEDNLKNIFIAFEKTARAENVIYQGVGLGLTITQNLINLMKGKLSIASTKNKGTEVNVFIPGLVKNEVVQNVDTKKIPDWKNYHILLADDDESNFVLSQRRLKETRAKFSWVRNGKEAIEKVTKCDDIDMIIMDLKMPVVDGLEATKQIKKIAPGIPIIAYSAWSLDAEKEMSKKAGCVDYFTKPFDIDRFISTVDDLLKNKKDFTDVKV